jgi:hypothetical protein
MTTRRFGGRLAFALALGLVFAAADANAQGAEPAPKAKPMQIGDVLSGQLNAMRLRGKNGKRVPSYEISSGPRRLPGPSGLCGLETGPETFQIVATSDAQVAQLRNYLGKEISVRVDEVTCSQEAGQMSDAVISKWSVVTRR